MRARSGLGRIAQVYSLVETMRSAEVRLAAAAVDEVAYAAAMERARAESQGIAGREALASGDRAEWQIAELQQGSAVVRMEWLASLRTEREQRLSEAREQHRASRVRREQVERVVDRTRQLDVVREIRLEQAIADDRFAGRLAWRRQGSDSA